MKKYKLIKTYPGLSPLSKEGMTVEQRDDNAYTLLNTGIHYLFHEKEIENWPEFWQEVKEPLFITEDGLEIYECSTLIWFVDLYQYNIRSCEYRYAKDLTDKFKLFSTNEAAEKWIEENKPIFSKKQLREAIHKWYEYSETWQEYVNSMRKDLDLIE